MEPFDSPWLVFENLPLPLIILSSTWEVQRVNRAFESYFGRGTKELRGVSAGELFGEITSSPSNSSWSGSSLLSNSGGQIPCSFRIRELGSDHYLITVVTASEEANLHLSFQDSGPEGENGETVIQRAEQQLSLLGHLAGGVAHDLNNILTGVLGHLSLIRTAGDSGSFQASLAAAEDGAKKACATAQQILEFARGREAQRKRVELSEVVDKVVSLLRVSIPKNISLKAQTEELYVLGDESELTQMLMNLAINARDAMPDGGELNFFLSEGRSDSTRLAVLVVQDSGQGIPPEIQERIFDPFFTTKEPGKGTGLGLSNVKRTIHRLGGTLNFHTESGIGTIFEICLPLCEPEVVEEVSKQIQTAEVSEKVLIVEDEDTVRLVMQRSLEHLGYEVDVAENGKAAVEIFKQDVNQYALVILDVMMPEMAGDELFVKLREFNPKIPCLVASGYASEKRTSQMLSAGRCGYIQKPFGVEDLAQEVRRCIDEYGTD